MVVTRSSLFGLCALCLLGTSLPQPAYAISVALSSHCREASTSLYPQVKRAPISIAAKRQSLYENCVAHSGMLPAGVNGQQAGIGGSRSLTVAMPLAFDAKFTGDEFDAPAKRLNLSGASLSKAEQCLATAIYFESRGEPLDGQIAVGQVVLNRVFSGFYSRDICAVIYQNSDRFKSCQFTFTCDGTPSAIKEPQAWEIAQTVSNKLLAGAINDEVAGATHFHATYVHPSWTQEMEEKARLGHHIFYRPKSWRLRPIDNADSVSAIYLPSGP